MLLVKLLTSSNANDSSNASFSYSNSNNSVSNANANRSFFYISNFFNKQNIKPYLLVKNNVVIEHSVSKYNIERSINRNIIMKRINGLFEKICTKDNIEYADDKASNDKNSEKIL